MDLDPSIESVVNGSSARLIVAVRRNSPDSVALDLSDSRLLMKRFADERKKAVMASSPSSAASAGTFHPAPSTCGPTTTRSSSTQGEKDNAVLLQRLAVGTRPSAALRRDSIEHNRRQSPTRLRDDEGSSSSSSALLPPAHIAFPTTHKNSTASRLAGSASAAAAAAPRRRSSMKKTSSTTNTTTSSSVATSSTKSLSFSASGSASASASGSLSIVHKRQRVRFSPDVRVKKFERPDDADLQRAWLSKAERSAIQAQAKADLKIIKRLSKEPDQVAADVRALRKTISLRGLEQFFSKRTLRALKEEQTDVIFGVLEAQQLQRQVSPHCYGGYGGPNELAQLSADLSRSARDRAGRQGREDEASVVAYLGRSTRAAAQPGFSFHPGTTAGAGGTATSSSRPTGTAKASRRGSMPTATEMMINNAQSSYRSGLSGMGDSIRSAPGMNLDGSRRASDY